MTEVHRLGPDREGCPVVQVPLQALRFHPRNIRSNLGDLDSLAASIRSEGVLVPLMAEKTGTGGLRLLHGHRRWAAADLAGLRRVPVQIVPKHTDDEAILLMLAENTGRAMVAVPDLRAATRALVKEFDYSPATIAERLGVPEETISAWLGGRVPVPHGPPGARPARRVPRAPVANPPPKIRPRSVHELLSRWDSGELLVPDLVAELRQWLGDWAPKSTAPASAGPNEEQADS